MKLYETIELDKNKLAESVHAKNVVAFKKVTVIPKELLQNVEAIRDGDKTEDTIFEKSVKRETEKNVNTMLVDENRNFKKWFDAKTLLLIVL